MTELSMIGLDLAKASFQVHGAGPDGSVVFRQKLARSRVLAFLARQPACTVAMEACASAHHWGREIAALGHEVRLVPPIYVKPFVRRQKNDAADAHAICEAASRPTMRFVPVKSAEQQAHAMILRTRELLVGQRTQTINALRGHLAEFGLVAPQGRAQLGHLRAALSATQASLPEAVVAMAQVLLQQIEDLDGRIAELEARIRRQVRRDERARRLTTIPGVGPIGAAAVTAFAPPAEHFRSGRDFAAWLGLTPRQASTGGKPRLGRISKMGQRDLRRLLIVGAMAVVRAAVRNGAPAGSWLARMLQRKPRKLVAVALANKNARTIWALLARGGVYRAATPAAA